MAAVFGEDVAAFLGQGDDPELVALAEQHLRIVAAMARAYTRGAGFEAFTGDPAEDIAAVITTATARLLANPEQIGRGIGQVQLRGGFTGWSLAELFVLNAYRKRAE